MKGGVWTGAIGTVGTWTILQVRWVIVRRTAVTATNTVHACLMLGRRRWVRLQASDARERIAIRCPRRHFRCCIMIDMIGMTRGQLLGWNAQR